MYFSHSNLIDQPALIRATRQMVSDAVPAAAATLDREQILAALALALADLDTSDPLSVIRSVDISAYEGKDMPLIKVSTRHYGALVTAAYLGELNEADQVPFDIADNYQVRLHALADAPVLHVIIRWPRTAAPVPISDLPSTLPHFADVRCVLSVATGDPFVLFNTDGVVLAAGDRGLACLGTGSDALANGVYAAGEASFARAPDAQAASDFTAGKVVRVREGDTYADTVWQVTTAPLGLGTSPIEFTKLTYPTNVDASQAHAHAIPRAAAYLAAQIAAQITDKNLAQKCGEWSASMLARPLPAHADALSRRVQTATRYAML